MKFTFKKYRPIPYTRPSCDIKLKGIIVGIITDFNKTYYIGFKVIKNNVNENNNPNCPWKWIYLANVFDSIDSAKDYLRQNCNNILSQYNLYKEPENE